MDLLTWIQQPFQTCIQSDIPWNITFVTKTYPLFFLEHIKHILYEFGYRVQHLRTDSSWDSIGAHLHTSVISNKKQVYLISMVQTELSGARTIEQLLTEYKGPHCLLIVCQKQIAGIEKNSVVVTLPEYITYEEYGVLFETIHTKTVSCPLIKKIFKQYAHLPLEQACNLMRYHPVLGSKHSVEEQYSLFLEEIVMPAQSMFRLSGYLFAKDTRSFLQLWEQMQHEYASPFWISFWSDQLFRAYWFVHAMQKHNKELAQQVAHRLPFSFIQKDWKKLPLQKMYQAHTYLYTLDNRIKNGSNAVFEILFMHILA